MDGQETKSEPNLEEKPEEMEGGEQPEEKPKETASEDDLNMDVEKIALILTTDPDKFAEKYSQNVDGWLELALSLASTRYKVLLDDLEKMNEVEPEDSDENDEISEATTYEDNAKILGKHVMSEFANNWNDISENMKFVQKSGFSTKSGRLFNAAVKVTTASIPYKEKNGDLLNVVMAIASIYRRYFEARQAQWDKAMKAIGTLQAAAKESKEVFGNVVEDAN